jgi:hypothetical protein
MNDEAKPTPEPENTPTPSSEVVPSTGGRVEVSADVLNEAVTQLRKLTELRQRETERQERAIAQMNTAIKRQGVLSRYVIFTSALVVLISIGLAYLMRQSAQVEQATQGTLEQVDTRLSETAQVVAQEGQRTASSLDAVRTEVLTARDEQTRLTADIKQQLQSSQQAQASVVQKVDEQLDAVRAERDTVRDEVRSVLEEKTELFTQKEIALREERESIKEAKKKSKEEQKELIQQTIDRLNAMTTALLTDEEAAAPTEAEVAAELEAANAVADEAAAETAGEAAPVEEAPAAGETKGVMEIVVDTAEEVVTSVGNLFTKDAEKAPETAVEEAAPEAAPEAATP